MGCNNNNCNCNCNNCDKVLNKYHYLVDKSDNLYSQAVSQQSEAISSVNDAIESLSAFKYLFNASYEVYNNATELLENSNCSYGCNANSCRCKNLDEKSDSLYYQQLNTICEALRMLQEALCTLNNAQNYGQEADKVYDSYKSCVHN